jgi:hypothetical protein
MAEHNSIKVFILAFAAFGIGWIVDWLIGSYTPALVTDPMALYYGISELAWLGIIALISLVVGAIIAFKVKPKKAKKGGAVGAIILIAVVAFLLGMVLGWIISFYYPTTLIVI